MITAAAFGELVNPDTRRKFNTRDGWNPENCMLTREFFKHLGNLSYDELATLARHMLNQTGEKRKHPYPKGDHQELLTRLIVNSVFPTRY